MDRNRLNIKQERKINVDKQRVVTPSRHLQSKGARRDRSYHKWNLYQRIGHNSLSFTLNLSERRKATLLESNQPARDMSHDINRAFKPISKKAGFKFPYGSVFEVSQHGKLHTHGFIVVEMLDDGLIREINAALKKRVVTSPENIKSPTTARMNLVGFTIDTAILNIVRREGNPGRLLKPIASVDFDAVTRIIINQQVLLRPR